MRPLLLAVLLAGEAGAAGLTAAGTLRRPLNARGTGMADAFTAVRGGLASLSYNPAGTTGLKKRELKTTYVHGSVDDKFTFLGYAHPLASAVLTAGLAYYDAGTITLELSDGTTGARKAQQDFVGLLGLSVPLSDTVSVGGQVKAMKLELAEEASATGGAADAGLLWTTPVKGLSLGAALLNAGPDVKYESEGDPLPLTYRGGAAYSFQTSPDSTFAFSNFTVAADFIKVREEEARASAGFEMAMSVSDFGTVALRTGYLFNDEAGSYAFGVGLTEGRFVLDYSLGVLRSLSNAHHVTFGLTF